MEGQLDRSAMTALQNIAGSTTQGAITSGSYEFDEDTMRTLITDWLELAESYDKSYLETDVLTYIKGPGLDFASSAHADAANASGEAYRAYLLNNRDYCYAQAQSFQDTLHDYLGIERVNVVEIGTAGQPGNDGSRAGF